MERVTGIGGVFFTSKDPERLFAWYEKHLGLKRDAASGGASVLFRCRDDHEGSGMTVWSIFPDETTYFRPSQARFMINYRVADLDALLEVLRQEGVEIDPKREDYDYGRFAWIMDPDGNRIELWEPPKA
jgi:catechol 2,3-dioxygenase-like lactoylglutathione lyase family enzyme